MYYASIFVLSTEHPFGMIGASGDPDGVASLANKLLKRGYISQYVVFYQNFPLNGQQQHLTKMGDYICKAMWYDEDNNG